MSRRRRRHSPYSDDSSNDSYSSSSDDDQFLQVLNRRKDSYDGRRRKRRNDADDGSESDSDNEMEYRREEEFDDGFDENLRGDEEDRRYLDSLPEVQREEIIYQRFERRRDQELLKERLRRAGKLIPRGQPMPSKRRKSTKVAPEKKRSKSRNERKSAAKRRRYDDDDDEEEEEDDESIEFDEEDEDLHDSDDDDDDDYEYEERRTARRKPTRAQEGVTGSRPRDMDIHERRARFEEGAIDRREKSAPREREATYEEMRKIIVSRKQIEKWVNEPFFDKLMQGCYVRFLLAKTEADKLTYRLCKIEEVEDRRRSYDLTNRIRTNKVFKLRFARSCNSNFKLNKVSNGPVSMSEYNHWLKAMRESNMPLPTVNEVREKADKIEECAHNYAYNAEDIRMKMDYKRKHLIDMDRTMLHREKTELDMQKHGLKNDLTIGNLTEEERQSKEAQYKEVKDRIRKVKNLLRRDEAPSQPTATASINQQARRHNREVLGKVVAAAMAEHETSRNARADTFDPFSRRATVSNFFAHSLLASPSPRGANPVLQVAPMSLEDVLPSPMLSPRGSTLANLYERFDVDLDFDKMDNTLAPHRLKLPPGFDYVPNGTTKFGKSLTLEEYAQRRI